MFVLGALGVLWAHGGAWPWGPGAFPGALRGVWAWGHSAGLGNPPRFEDP